MGPPSGGATPGSAPADVTCPQPMIEAPPGVRQLANVKAALATMPATPQGGPYTPPDLAALAKAHAGAFAVSLPAGYLHESDTPHDVVHAVFVQPARVTVVYHLADEVHPIPNRCGDATGSAVTDVAIVNPHVGHVRVRRAGIADAPTLAVALTNTGRRPACDCTETFRIEDHFIDLDSGEHLRAYAQAYRAHCYATEPAPVLPFDRFTVDDGGIEITGTSCRYFWND